MFCGHRIYNYDPLKFLLHNITKEDAIILHVLLGFYLYEYETEHIFRYKRRLNNINRCYKKTCLARPSVVGRKSNTNFVSALNSKTKVVSCFGTLRKCI